MTSLLIVHILSPWALWQIVSDKQKSTVISYDALFLSGGDKRDRTADLLNAIQALSQLSYTPIFNCTYPLLLHFKSVR